MADQPENVTRRGFIETSLKCVATAGIAAVVPTRILGQTPEKKPAVPAKPQGEIIYRTLGRTGIKIPVVSMGVMNNNSPDIVRASYEIGIRHFDTAARYQYGRNEQMVGSVIKQLGVRDKVIISTKEIQPGRPGMSAAEVKQKMIELCDASLQRLQMDYVDIFYLHSVSEAEEMKDPGILEAITQLKKQGKVRAIGVSTHQNMAVVINEAAKGGVFDVVLTSINVSMANDTELLGAIAGASKAGVGIVAMKTQSGGGRLPNSASLRDYSSSTIATACLKWVLNNENITTAIPGYDNFQHMEEDFSVARNLGYTADEEKFLGDNRLTVGLAFCRQCRKCEPTCPHRVDIPSLMRTHMYAAQYANFQEARHTLDTVPSGRGLTVCKACPNCSATCANCVDIAGRIENLKMIYA